MITVSRLAFTSSLVKMVDDSLMGTKIYKDKDRLV